MSYFDEHSHSHSIAHCFCGKINSLWPWIACLRILNLHDPLIKVNILMNNVHKIYKIVKVVPRTYNVRGKT